MCDGKGGVYEALANGIVLTPISSDNPQSETVLKTGGGKIMVLRHHAVENNSALAQTVLINVRRWAGELGEPKIKYDTLGAVGQAHHTPGGKIAFMGASSLSPGVGQLLIYWVYFAESVNAYNAATKSQDETFYCSEAVARAYEVAGIPLAFGSQQMPASQVYPARILQATNLRLVGYLRNE